MKTLLLIEYGCDLSCKYCSEFRDQLKKKKIPTKYFRLLFFLNNDMSRFFREGVASFLPFEEKKLSCYQLAKEIFT